MKVSVKGTILALALTGVLSGSSAEVEAKGHHKQTQTTQQIKIQQAQKFREAEKAREAQAREEEQEALELANRILADGYLSRTLGDRIHQICCEKAEEESRRNRIEALAYQMIERHKAQQEEKRQAEIQKQRAEQRRVQEYESFKAESAREAAKTNKSNWSFSNWFSSSPEKKTNTDKSSSTTTFNDENLIYIVLGAVEAILAIIVLLIGIGVVSNKQKRSDPNDPGQIAQQRAEIAKKALEDMIQREEQARKRAAEQRAAELKPTKNDESPHK